MRIIDILKQAGYDTSKINIPTPPRHKTIEQDKTGKETYGIRSDGLHYKHTYDTHGNLVQMSVFSEVSGQLHEISRYVYPHDYDERGNLIHYKDRYSQSDVIEFWQEFDEQNRLVKYKDDRGTEYTLSYEENSVIQKNKDGTTIKKTYDRQKRIILEEHSDGSWKEYEYKEDITHYKDSKGYEYWDQKNKKINKFWNRTGDESIMEFDDKGRISHTTEKHERTNEFRETWMDYDNEGLLAVLSFDGKNYTLNGKKLIKPRIT